MNKNTEAVIVTVGLCTVNRRELVNVTFHGTAATIEIPMRNLITGEFAEAVKGVSTPGVTQEFYKLTENNPTTLRIPYMSKTITKTVADALRAKGVSYRQVMDLPINSILDLLMEANKDGN